MKIKTFIFEDNTIFSYIKECYRIDTNDYYCKHTYLIDNTINSFLNDNNIEIIDIKISSVVVGNNPPTSNIVYTIIYKEIK